MLEEFLWKQNTDLALLQEVTNPNLSKLCRYSAYINEGTDGRGTAILAKKGLTISNIKGLPSGWGRVARFNRPWILNIYAPSGAEKKKKRERFYNNDLAHLLSTAHAEMMLAGDLIVSFRTQIIQVRTIKAELSQASWMDSASKMHGMRPRR